MFDKYNEVLKAAKELGGKTARTLKLRVILDEAIFYEAFESAKTSCRFHGVGEVNHIKKVSHLSFWIIKLKPYTLAPRIMGSLLRRTGADSIINAVDEDYTQRFEKAFETPINELMGLSLADYLISKGFDNITKKLIGEPSGNPGMDKAEEVARKHKDNRNRVKEMTLPLVMSFREHNYSSRAFATMMSLAYSTGHESLHHHE